MLVRHAQVSWGLEVPDAPGGEGLRGGSRGYVQEAGSRGCLIALGPFLSIVKSLGIIAVRVRHSSNGHAWLLRQSGASRGRHTTAGVPKEVRAKRATESAVELVKHVQEAGGIEPWTSWQSPTDALG